MSLNRYRARSDLNHKAITRALRDAKVSFWQIDWPCDLLALRPRDRVPVFLEIKSSAKAKLTDDQLDLQARIAGGFFYRVETVEQALQAVGVTCTD